MKDDRGLSEFLETLCTSCHACPNLITLEPDPDQCEKCASQNLKRTASSANIKIERQSPPPVPIKKKSTPEPEIATSTSSSSSSNDSHLLSTGNINFLF